MKTALIGHTGFVGGNLVQQHAFDDLYNSSNIGSLEGRSYDLVVCSGVQAKKWWANANPDEDWAGIQHLLKILETVQAGKVILISTVDVYPVPKGVTENTPIDPSVNHAYGRHRYEVERFVAAHFPSHLILRLPGLFGVGIKKNVIHDLLNQHELEKINPAGVFQYYYLRHLWEDIQRAEKLGLRVLNISTEAVATSEIIEKFFAGATVGQVSPFATNYDMRSLFAAEWGCDAPGYLYSKEAVLEDLAHFISSYRHSVP